MISCSVNWLLWLREWQEEKQETKGKWLSTVWQDASIKVICLGLVRCNGKLCLLYYLIIVLFLFIFFYHVLWHVPIWCERRVCHITSKQRDKEHINVDSQTSNVILCGVSVVERRSHPLICCSWPTDVYLFICWDRGREDDVSRWPEKCTTISVDLVYLIYDMQNLCIQEACVLVRSRGHMIRARHITSQARVVRWVKHRDHKCP